MHTKCVIIVERNFNDDIWVFDCIFNNQLYIEPEADDEIKGARNIDLTNGNFSRYRYRKIFVADRS